MLLSEIPNNQKVEVVQLIPSSLKVKLMEMGITEGKSLKVLYRAPFGDPIAVDLGSSVLSLRKEEAALVKVNMI